MLIEDAVIGMIFLGAIIIIAYLIVKYDNVDRWL